MCGIAGILDFRRSLQEEALAALVLRMTRTLAHRGPDGEGTWVNTTTGCALGHRRLSIIDTTKAGAQPMLSPDGRFAVTFNGEIYNFLELRREMELAGVVFRSRSDTEVLLEAYRHWGRQCLSRLDGMFAFAIHDTISGETVLARDPFGEKPLYYAWLQGRLAFASEVMALREVPGFDNSVSLDAVAEYLALQYVDGEDTLYRQVNRLRPGSALAVSRSGAVESWRYFEFNPVGDGTSDDLDGLTDELEEILVRSLERRLISDVPLGAFLSGGVDSSLVAALVTRRLGRPLKTFTLGFAGSEQSEHHVARRIAEHLGTDHHERVLETSAVSLSRGLGEILDEPNADTSCLPTYLLAAFAREQVTVAVSGDGGDELFAGYSRYMRTMLDCGAGARGAGAPAAGAIYYSDRIMVFPDPDLLELFGSVPGRLMAKLAELRSEIDSGPSELLHRMRKSDVAHYLPGAVLAKVDRMSMRHGLEVRTPFLSVELARFVERLPARHLVDGGRGKILLKRLACRYLPADIVHRPKSGFGLPTDLWGEEPLMAQAEPTLFAPTTRLFPFMSTKALQRFRNERRRFRGNRVYQLWAMLLLQSHLEAHRCRPVVPPREHHHVAVLLDIAKSGAPVAIWCRSALPSWLSCLPAGSIVFRADATVNDALPHGHYRVGAEDAGSELAGLLRGLATGLPPRLILVNAVPEHLPPEVAHVFRTITWFDGSSWEDRNAVVDPHAAPGRGTPDGASVYVPLWYDLLQQELLVFPRSARRARLTAPGRVSGDVPLSRLESLYSTGGGFQRATPRRAWQLLREGAGFAGDRIREAGNRRVFRRCLASEARSGEVAASRRLRSVLLFTSHLGAGGAERQLCNLAAGLSDAGCDVVIVTVQPASGRSRHYQDLLDGKHVRVHALGDWADAVSLAPLLDDRLDRLCVMDALPRAFRSDVWSLVAAIHEIKPDVVHCFLDHPNIVGGLAGVITGVRRVVVSFRNFNPSHLPFHRTWFLTYYRWLLESRRLLATANSRAGLRDYAGWLGVAEARVHFVPNGLDFDRFVAACPMDQGECRARWGVPDGVPVIAGVFRLSPEKRPGLFVDTILRVRQQLPNLRVLMAGEGSLELEIRRRIETAGLGECVTMLGRTTEVAKVMRAADVLLLTSAVEGTPNVLLEAQGLGVPVVATSASGACEDAVEGGVTGYVVADDNEEDLVARTIELLSDVALRRRFGRSGPVFVRERFAIARMVGDYRRLYELAD